MLSRVRAGWQWLVIHLWRHRQQKIDMQILWPSFREQAENIGIARRAFRKHMDMDPAYGYMTEKERNEFVLKLPE